MTKEEPGDVIPPAPATTLFVYGTLLDAGHREQILGRRVGTMTATIRDYERGRRRYFYLRRRPGIDTPGLLLLDLTGRDFTLIDIYEAVPRLYTREQVEVVDPNRMPLRCWIYLPTVHVLTGQNQP
jgi:tRNA nucleotidyltransferase/poly(A) polymerase